MTVREPIAPRTEAGTSKAEGRHSTEGESPVKQPAFGEAVQRRQVQGCGGRRRRDTWDSGRLRPPFPPRRALANRAGAITGRFAAALVLSAPFGLPKGL